MADGKKGLTGELGVYRSTRLGSTLYDDYLPQLRGPSAAKIYREMADNDATVGGMLFAVDMLLREVEWDVEPDGEDPRQTEAADLVRECFSDMEHTMEDHISAALSMLPFGYSIFEKVYRPRSFKEGSKYDDKKLGWRKFGYRPQDTILEFVQAEDSQAIAAVRQQVKSGYVDIPYGEKILHYRTTAQRGPEGKSALRNAYLPWYYRKRATEIAMIGIERDLAGLPIARIPARNIIAQDDVYLAVQSIVTRTKRDEQEGIIWPGDKDENGNPLYEFELLSPAGGSARIAQTLQVIQYFGNQIAQTILADFINIGHTTVGSRALAEPKQELFQIALEAWADQIANVLTADAVPQLLALNGFPPEIRPRVKHSAIEEVDINALASFISTTTNAGMPWFTGNPEIDHPLDSMLRRLAGLTPLQEDDYGKVVEEKQKAEAEQAEQTAELTDRKLDLMTMAERRRTKTVGKSGMGFDSVKKRWLPQ